MITLHDVWKSYGTKEHQTHVLKGIDLQIAEGDFVVILGASGSGKSTLLHVLSGLERIDQGTITYGTQSLHTMNDAQLTKFRRDHVGFIFQQYYLLPHLSVEKNVRMGADLAANSEYRELLSAVGLGAKAHKRPADLSGGEQQRVAIARALAKHPDVLFLDEPTGALDEEMGRQILRCISDMHKQYGCTVIMVTHNQNIAEMAHTIIHMNSGQIRSITHQTTVKTADEIGW